MPFGFICGYPVASASSEYWGYVEGQSGSHPQALAVKAAVERWGGPGCTELAFPVCKTGYRPRDLTTGARLFACARHDAARRAALRAAGWRPRPGWESFRQARRAAFAPLHLLLFRKLRCSRIHLSIPQWDGPSPATDNAPTSGEGSDGSGGGGAAGAATEVLVAEPVAEAEPA